MRLQSIHVFLIWMSTYRTHDSIRLTPHAYPHIVAGTLMAYTENTYICFPEIEHIENRKYVLMVCDMFFISFRRCRLKYGLSEAWEPYKKLSVDGSSILAEYEPVASHWDPFGKA